ncbi:short-chain dehydrogenase [Rhodocollybia butyracea]|uniref:Short-chain dehydrogenase n=1 Tax=Rhodocollybia butyracea TaxID=206335 RepID=A0A9P5PXB1_9AGAR|nr:short-chain dehydrogenase [Rhodocollybia butyracea]
MVQRSYQVMVDEQKKGMVPVVKGDLTGKTVVITGANSGIGYEAAKHFATMNTGRLIIVCRSLEKARGAIKQIEAETGYKNAEPMALDLSDFSSISTFATQANKTLDRLDILVENAGVAKTGQYFVTNDGWEEMFQVNGLGTTMHAILLLPVIFKTAKEHSVAPRIVVVSSEIIFSANIGPDALAASNTLEMLSSKEYCTPDRYALSKLFNVFLVHKLAALLPKNIIPVSLNPGFCLSGLRRHASGALAEQYDKMDAEFAYTSEEGSRQIVYAAIGGTDEEVRGAFTSYSQVLGVPDWILSEDGKKAQDKTWDEMLELFSKLDNRIPSIIADYLKA